MITAKEALDLALGPNLSRAMSEEYFQVYKDEVESRVKFELTRILNQEIRTMEKAIYCDESWLAARKDSLGQSARDSVTKDIANMRNVKEALEQVKRDIEGTGEEDK